MTRATHRPQPARLLVAALVLALAATPGASGARPAGPASLADAQTAFEVWSDALDRTVEPGTDESCGVTVTRPEATPVEVGCAEPGSDTEAADGSDDAAGLELREKAAMELPRFWTELAPLDAGVDGAVVRVHGYGTVAAMDADGETLWQRVGSSFLDEWAVASERVPFVYLGRAPADPFTWASKRAFGVGDLTGDGRTEVVVAHVVYADEPQEVGLSAVTVLDGATGETRWHRLYPGAVTGVVVHDGMLFVGEETGDPITLSGRPIGEAGTSSRLHALAFPDETGELAATDAWVLPTARPWARWLGIEPAGLGRVAAAWTAKPLGEDGDAGRVLVLDTASGTPVWQQTTDGYPRTLRHDAAP